MLDHEEYFGMQICYLKHALFRVAQGVNLLVCDLCKEQSTCSFFLVDDLYYDLKLEYFQQGKLNKDLRQVFFSTKGV